MKRSPMRFLFYMCYVFSWPVLHGLYFFSPGLKEGKLYDRFFKDHLKVRTSVTYPKFRMYMADLKVRDKMTHTLLLFCSGGIFISILMFLIFCIQWR